MTIYVTSLCFQLPIFHGVYVTQHKFIVAENRRQHRRRDYRLREWKTSVFSSSQKGIHTVLIDFPMR